MTEEELDSRLSGIVAGPWAQSKSALKTCKFLKPPFALNAEQTTLDLTNVKAGAERDGKLQQLLAPHWIRSVSPDELWLRIGLDEALTGAMLLELAIECGYIDPDRVQRQGRELLAPLLWSKAVQTYIIDYDYFAVLFLALRVGIKIDRVRKIRPPAIDPHGAVAFSTFIAYYRIFFEDHNVWHFLRLLDDYTSRKIRKKKLWQALRREADPSDAIIDASEGAIRFLEHLAAIERLAKNTIRAPFALFYGYWLAKFFGYELEKGAYRKSDAEYDWSKRISSLCRLAQTELHRDGEIALVSGARSLWESARSASLEYVSAFRM